jgi:hypothetical protein
VLERIPVPPARLELDRPRLVGSVGHLEPGEDGRDVVGDGLAAEGELLGDLVVVVAGGQQVQDLAFPGGQLREGVGVAGGVAK